MQDDEITGKVYDSALIKRMFTYTRPFKKIIAFAVFILLVGSFLQLIAPYLTKEAIDIYISTDNLDGLNAIVALYIAVLLAIFFVQYTQIYITQLLGQKLMYDLRADIFGHLQKLSLSFFDKNPVGRLMTRVTSDVESLNQMFTQGVVNIFGNIFLLIGIMAVMISINLELALWTFVVVPMLAVVTWIFKRKVRFAFSEIRKWLAQINTYLQENITGMNLVQIFNRQQKNYNTFTGINQKHTNAHVKTVNYYAVFYPVIEVVGAIALTIVLVRGGILKIEQAATYGALVAFIQYAQMFFRPISDLSDKINILQGAIASAERIFKLLDTKPDIENINNAQKLGELKGEIEFQDVSFAYNDNEWVLENIDFKIPAGSSVAIVGHTGAGKTSLINLLGRQYELQKGKILIDGLDIRSLKLTNLRKSMAMVLQDIFLFSGSIYDNISLGNPLISMDDVIEACKKVNAHFFIDKLPQKYDTVLNERGTTLSMGQRQLLSFARALVVNPHILILDEATSNIDTETEILIQNALDFMMQKRTSIIIAHRLSTIKHVDKILVFHKGHLKEMGSHSELMTEKGLYYQLYKLQYKDQEKMVV